MDPSSWYKYLSSLNLFSRIKNLRNRKVADSYKMPIVADTAMSRNYVIQADKSKIRIKNFKKADKTKTQKKNSLLSKNTKESSSKTRLRKIRNCCPFRLTSKRSKNRSHQNRKRKDRKHILNITRGFNNSEDYCYLPTSLTKEEPENVPPRWTIDPRDSRPPMERSQSQDRIIIVRYLYENDDSGSLESENGEVLEMPVKKQVRFHPFRKVSMSEIMPFLDISSTSSSDGSSEGIFVRLREKLRKREGFELLEDSSEDEDNDRSKNEMGNSVDTKRVSFADDADVDAGIGFDRSTSEESLKERILNEYQHSFLTRAIRRRKKVEKEMSKKDLNLNNDENENWSTSTSESSDDGGDFKIALPKGFKNLKSYGEDYEKLAKFEYRSQMEDIRTLKIPGYTLSGRKLKGENSVFQDEDTNFVVRTFQKLTRSQSQWPN